MDKETRCFKLDELASSLTTAQQLAKELNISLNDLDLAIAECSAESNQLYSEIYP